MKISNILIICAIILSPLIALQTSKFLENRGEKKSRRLDVFRTLMATRASLLSYDRVNALNSIYVEFYGNDIKSKNVVEAWKIYWDNLNDHRLEEKAFESWASKNNELFIELLQKMAICLDYDFDKSSINKTSYSPERYGTVESETNLIRKGLVDLLTGKNAIPVEITSDGSDEEKKKFRDLLEKYLSKEIPLKIILSKKE